MTRKDYIALASAIRYRVDRVRDASHLSADVQSATFLAIYDVARELCNALARDNGRFDRERFLAACGLDKGLDIPAPAADVYTWKLASRRTVGGEYVLRCYRNGVKWIAGDYFTTDREDALATLAELTKAATVAPKQLAAQISADLDAVPYGC